MGKKLNVVLFSGGRGASSIASVLSENPEIHLTVLVNAYDDGLSTGCLRAFIPGMLGPSDVRKNISNLMPKTEKRFRSVLDYRFPLGTERDTALGSLIPLAEMRGAPGDQNIANEYTNLSIQQARSVGEYCEKFLDYEKTKLNEGVSFDYGDCSIGNILFAGCYLENNHNFNKTCSVFSALCEVDSIVLNITDGHNYVLVALKKDGEFLPDEASIVMPQTDVPIQEIFLLAHYLSHDTIEKLKNIPADKRCEFLKTFSQIPMPNIEAIKALSTADLIIYGPGTQYSSLFPSYLTDGIAEAISANSHAEKVFVGNIVHDHDIQNKSVADIIDRFLFYMNRKGAEKIGLSSLVTQLFVQEPDPDDINREHTGSYVPVDIQMDNLEQVSLKKGDWEVQAGRHAGGQIVDAVLSIVQEIKNIKIKPTRHTLSIIIPALNEARTIRKVLDDIRLLDLTKFDLNKEIILVDGGSSDETVSFAQAQKGVHVYALEREKGRGSALRLGIAKARGNIIVFFPADAEYNTEDIIKIVEPIINYQFNVVFGSRAIKCFNLDDRIYYVYGKNWIAYFISKYGGMMFSILSLLLYNRYITDPFSTLKAFDSSLLRSLDLRSHGINLESEIIAKLGIRHEFILEIPVEYSPRTKKEGKKTTVRDGISALAALIKFKIVGI